MGEIKVFKPVKAGTSFKFTVDPRRALTRDMVEGKEDVKARPATKGMQDPDLKD